MRSYLHNHPFRKFESFKGRVVSYFGRGVVIGNLNSRFLVYFNVNEEVEPGDVVELKGEFIPADKYILISNGINGIIRKPEIISIEPQKGILGLVNKIRKRIYMNMVRILGYYRGNMVSSLITGRVRKIPPYMEQRFKKAGLMHLLAVSGLHIGAILIFSLLLIKFIGVERGNFFLKFMLIILPVLLYAILAGMRHSVVRAAIMGIMVGGALVSGRNVNIWNSLGHALWMNLLIYPWALLSPGFQLSYAAVISIIVTIKMLPVMKNIFLRYVLYPFLISIGVQLWLIPLLLLYFKGISPISPFTNITGSFMVSFIIPSAFLLSFLSFIYKPVLLLLSPFSWIMDAITGFSFYIDFKREPIFILVPLSIAIIVFLTGYFRRKTFIPLLIGGYAFIIIFLIVI